MLHSYAVLFMRTNSSSLTKKLLNEGTSALHNMATGQPCHGGRPLDIQHLLSFSFGEVVQAPENSN